MTAPKRSGIWFGLGLGTQAQSLFWGAGKYTLRMAALESHLVRFQANTYWKQSGFGVNISKSLSFVVITNLWNPTTFHLTEPLGFDLQLNFDAFLRPSLQALRLRASSLKLDEYSASVLFNLHTWAEFQKRIGLLLNAKTLKDLSQPSDRPRIGFFDITPGIVKRFSSIGVSATTIGPAAVVVTGGW